MNIVENKKLKIMEGKYLSIGHSIDMKVIGVCLFDRYCWTNIFGFEKI